MNQAIRSFIYSAMCMAIGALAILSFYNQNEMQIRNKAFAEAKEGVVNECPVFKALAIKYCSKECSFGSDCLDMCLKGKTIETAVE